MVPYFGRHGTKQFIRGKPIRWEYKLWVGTSTSGYVEWVEPYQGSTTIIDDQYKELGLGASIVLQFAEILQNRFPSTQFHLYFDNLFTSIALLEKLKVMGLKRTGAIRENAVGKNCPLTDSNQLKITNILLNILPLLID